MRRNKKPTPVALNKHDIRDFLSQHLAEFRSTLKATSLDKQNEVHLCDNSSFAPVYNFDRYIQEHHQGVKHPASPDAICVGEKQLYFVEFKNQQLNDINKLNIKNKFEQGTTILKSLLADFRPRDCKRFFYVVHARSTSRQNPRRFNAGRHIEATTLRWHLEQLNTELGGFYDGVKVADADEFIESHDELSC